MGHVPFLCGVGPITGELLAHFIRDVRRDFAIPKMPFVIGVIGTGDKPESDNPFGKAMIGMDMQP